MALPQMPHQETRSRRCPHCDNPIDDAEFAAERAELERQWQAYPDILEMTKALATLKAERAELIEALRTMLEEFGSYANEQLGKAPGCLKKARAVLAKYPKK